MNTLLLALLVSCNWTAPPVYDGPPRPDADAPLAGGQTNVLFIVIDTLRADHLGSYGYTIPTSPYLDGIARTGVRFENFFSNSSWTRPSMASILTGEYPRCTGIHEEKFDRLDQNLTTLGERFKAHGYATMGVTANANLNKAFGFGQGFDMYSESGAVWGWMRLKKGQRRYKSKDNNLDDARSVTNRALVMADEHAGDGPFYMQLLYVDPHEPYKAATEYQAKVIGSRKPGYDGDIRYVDDELKRLLDGLKQRGMMENTLIVITSDHGEGLFDHPDVPDAATHGTAVYDSTLHVPLLVWHPSLSPNVVSDLSDGVDLVPTFMDILGWAGTPDLPGQSLAPLITGSGPVAQADVVFAETDWRANRKVTGRSLQWKYIYNKDTELWQTQGIRENRKLRKPEQKHLDKVPHHELYPVPGPQMLKHNVVKKHANVAADLDAKIRQWEAATCYKPPINRHKRDGMLLKDGTVVPEQNTGGGDGEIDEATRELLERMGYLQDGDEDAPKSKGKGKKKGDGHHH